MEKIIDLEIEEFKIILKKRTDAKYISLLLEAEVDMIRKTFYPAKVEDIMDGNKINTKEGKATYIKELSYVRHDLKNIDKERKFIREEQGKFLVEIIEKIHNIEEKKEEE